MHLFELEQLIHRQQQGSGAQVAQTIDDIVLSVEDRCLEPGQQLALDGSGRGGVQLDKEMSLFYRLKYRHLRGACDDVDLGISLPLTCHTLVLTPTPFNPCLLRRPVRPHPHSPPPAAPRFLQGLRGTPARLRGSDRRPALPPRPCRTLQHLLHWPRGKQSGH